MRVGSVLRQAKDQQGLKYLRETGMVLHGRHGGVKNLSFAY